MTYFRVSIVLLSIKFALDSTLGSSVYERLSEKTMQPAHPWKARLSVGIIMLVLAFLGMVVTDVRTVGGWDYWKWMVPVYAILPLWLGGYDNRKNKPSPRFQFCMNSFTGQD